MERVLEAEEVQGFLAGRDWRTYAEQQGESWTVAFVSKGKTLFSALVDVGAGEVLETDAP